MTDFIEKEYQEYENIIKEIFKTQEDIDRFALAVRIEYEKLTGENDELDK